MQSETAERILGTARTLIGDLGYSAFSYADIAAVIHIRKASIHHHFPTKADLVVAVLKDHQKRFLHGRELLTRTIDNPLERLRSYLQHWENCIEDSSQPFCIAALLAAELPSLPEEVRYEVQRYFLDLSGWIRDTLEEGVSRSIVTLQGTLEDEAQMFMAAVHGAMLSARALGNCGVFKAVTSGALQRISKV